MPQKRGIPAADSFLRKIDVVHLGVSVLSPSETYGPTSSPRWTLGWMMDGSAVTVVDGESIELAAGVGILTRPGEEVLYHWGADDHLRHGFVVFSGADDEPDLPRRIEIPQGGVVEHLLEHILWLEGERPPGWWSAVAPAFEAALRAIVGRYDTGAASDEHSLPAPIVDSLRFAARSWARGDSLAGIRLQDLARAAGVTPEHLCRVYTHELGVGPVTAFRLIRLKRAATLLAQTNLSVAEVSRRIGFGSEFHFSRTFKAFAGVSPSVFRSSPAMSLELPPPVRRLHNYLNASHGET